MDNYYNIRVYGIAINNNSVMLGLEKYKNYTFLKFPGGGMEHGEGTISCLEREFQEELKIKIAVKDHFYTTDFYQKSLFDNRQIISIYYFIEIPDSLQLPLEIDGNKYDYYTLNKSLLNKVTLPIDKIIVQKLLDKLPSPN